MSEFALLFSLHLASMLTPGLNATAVLANTFAAGTGAGYKTAFYLSLGALMLSALSVFALGSLLESATFQKTMLMLSTVAIVYFCLKSAKGMLNSKIFETSDKQLGGLNLLFIYIFNPQSIIFFSVLIFSVGIEFSAVNSLIVIFMLTANTLLYYSLIAALSGVVARKFTGRTMQVITYGGLLFFLLVLLSKNLIELAPLACGIVLC